MAGERAVDFVTSRMVLGLGHGSTAIFALRRIAELLDAGELRDIVGIPTSSMVRRDARDLGIPLTTLNDHPEIDLTIDGADEVDNDLNLIKGGGGALLREKIVAQASRREIIVVDESKLSPTLGIQWPVPIEVTPFGWRSQEAFLKSLGARVTLRRTDDGSPFKTDQGNLILDCDFGTLSNPREVADRLDERAGIVEHGLFLRLASDVIVGTEQGIQHLKNPRRSRHVASEGRGRGSTPTHG
jgi:ribose 5-phosphate isomerase A